MPSEEAGVELPEDRNVDEEKLAKLPPVRKQRPTVIPKTGRRKFSNSAEEDDDEDSKPTRRKAVSKAKPGPEAKHQWTTIREEFVMGIPTADGSIELLNQRELAERHKVSYQLLRNRATKERWASLRTKAQTELAAERQRKRSQTIVNDSLKFDDSAFNIARLGTMLVVSRMGEIVKEHQTRKPLMEEALKRQLRGEHVDKWELQSPIYHRELESLAGAAERFQAIGMRALGTDIQRHEVHATGEITNNVSIVAELHRDDPDRLAALMHAMQLSGLTGFVDDDDENLVDAEVVADDESDAEEDSGKQTKAPAIEAPQPTKEAAPPTPTGEKDNDRKSDPVPRSAVRDETPEEREHRIAIEEQRQQQANRRRIQVT